MIHLCSHQLMQSQFVDNNFCKMEDPGSIERTRSKTRISQNKRDKRCFQEDSETLLQNKFKHLSPNSRQKQRQKQKQERNTFAEEDRKVIECKETEDSPDRQDRTQRSESPDKKAVDAKLRLLLKNSNREKKLWKGGSLLSLINFAVQCNYFLTSDKHFDLIGQYSQNN